MGLQIATSRALDLNPWIQYRNAAVHNKQDELGHDPFVFTASHGAVDTPGNNITDVTVSQVELRVVSGLPMRLQVGFSGLVNPRDLQASLSGLHLSLSEDERNSSMVDAATRAVFAANAVAQRHALACSLRSNEYNASMASMDIGWDEQQGAVVRPLAASGSANMSLAIAV